MGDTGDVQLFKIQIQSVTGPVRLEASPEKFIDATRDTLNGISQLVEESCTAFVNKIGKLADRPNEIGIEFGVDVSAEAGIPFVTKGSLGANFKISLKWTRA